MIRDLASPFGFTAPLFASSVIWLATVSSGQPAEERLLSATPGDDLFTNGSVCRLRIDLSPDAFADLKSDARKYVAAAVTERNTKYLGVGVHLKGSVGSFRPLEDKPSLTLDFSRFGNGQRFHGLRKIHLNNSVEDPSYVNEIIGSELFNAGGVPAPRVTRALLTLNGRPLGLYVLKEGFTEDFLARHFQRLSGELFEPEEGHDVDQQLKRNSVLAPAGNRTALKTLAEAALEPDPARRWRQLQTALDTDRFITFMSLEIMLGHRDGYCLARNNFRVYHDVDSDKMVFFPHGMDQLFGTADFPWKPTLAGLVANAVMTTPQGAARYSASFGSLLTNVFKIEALTNEVDQLVQVLRPVLTRDDWLRIREAASVVKERMIQRQRSLVSQLNQPVRKPMDFDAGVGQLSGWKIAEAPPKGKIDQVTAPMGQPALHILAAGATAAAWRTTALLPRGTYRFEGRVCIANVEPLAYGIHHGAGLRVRGRSRQMDSFTGDSTWRLLVADFRVEQPTEDVEFICELRARTGEAWFELNSLRVLQMGEL